MGIFRDFFTGLFNSIKSGLDSIQNGVSGSLNTGFGNIQSAVKAIPTKLDTAVKTPLSVLKDGVDGVKITLKDSVGNPINITLNTINNMGKEIRDKVSGVTNALTGMKNDFSTQLTNIKNALFDTVKSPLDTINNTIKDFKTGLLTTIITTITNSTTLITDPIKGIKELLSKVKDILDLTGKYLPFSPIGMQVNAINILGKLNNVELMETVYNALPTEVQNIPAVKNYYETEKASLKEQGMDNLLSAAMNPIAKGLAEGIWAVEKLALPKITAWIDEFGEQYHIERTELDRMSKLANTGEFGLNAVVSFILGVTVQPAISVATAPLWEAAGQQVWQKIPVRLMDIGTLVRLKYKGFITDDYFNSEMGKQGFSPEAIIGFLNDYKFVPSPGDVIKWSVREAFYEDYVKHYGLDDEYPIQLDEYGKILGMNTRELKYFWRSHWELPSSYQGFEMLHRAIITPEDLDKLFMAADIMPFWRDKLKGLSYSVYTRVDIRRMFKAGVIDRAAVKRGYLDRGYDDDHAENLTIWTVSDTISKERDLTRGNIEKLYEEGQITRETAGEYLLGLRYDKDETEYLLSLIDIKIANETEKELLNLWIDQFKIHEIDIKGLESNLDTLTITTEKKKRIVTKAKRIELGFITKPPKTDLLKWYSNGIITKEKFSEEMRGLGYTEASIKNYDSMAELGGE